MWTFDQPWKPDRGKTEPLGWTSPSQLIASLVLQSLRSKIIVSSFSITSQHFQNIQSLTLTHPSAAVSLVRVTIYTLAWITVVVFTGLYFNPYFLISILNHTGQHECFKMYIRPQQDFAQILLMVLYFSLSISQSSYGGLQLYISCLYLPIPIQIRSSTSPITYIYILSELISSYFHPPSLSSRQS